MIITLPIPSGLLRLGLLALLALAACLARAELVVEITGAGATRFPVVIPVFEDEGSLPHSVSDVVRTDLERSGRFGLIDIGPLPLPESRVPDFESMRQRGASAVLTGSVLRIEGGRYEIRFRLYDTHKNTELGAMLLRMAPSQNRLTGHRIADFVYEKLYGLPGYFSTRIAYVIKNGQRYELQIADADGMGAQPALRSNEPIISPAWAPDGQRLAYVSFEAQKPIVYIHTLATGQRRVVANFKGSNSAPAWAPDGTQLAVVLTKDGLSQLYVINADGSGVRRIAASSGIDTEPFWSPDGEWIYFTSDRGGNPQIYRIPTRGGATQRVTFDGTYNVTPRISPDGRILTFVTRNNGRFQVAVQDLSTHQTTILTDSARDESPSFAPNGQMILYATQSGGRGVLAVVSSDGLVRQRLSVQAADVREPSWGPLQR
jgi:TolB protein